MVGEISILGALLECNGDCPPFLRRLLDHAPESFSDGNCARVAVAIKGLRISGKPANAITVAGEVRFENSTAFISRALSEALPASVAEFKCEQLWKEFQSRRTAQLLNDASNAIASKPDQAASVRAHVRAELERLDADNQDGLPPIVDAADFMAQQLATPPELVAGIFHRGSKLALGGCSKSFKTWTLLDMAVAVATGANWLGFATERGKVLFVNFEIQPHSWQRRIAAVTKAKAVELKPGAIQLWNLRGYAADFRQLVPKIIERARREGFALIVLDPLYKLYGGTDENAAGDVAALLNALERLAVDAGAAVAYGCHFAKGNASAKEAIDRISGSGVFARDPDSLLIFTKHETPDAFTVEPILRNFAPVAPFVVSWQFPLMIHDEALDPAKLKQVAGRKPENSPDDLLKLLPADGLTNADFLDAAYQDGISKRTFYRLRKSLEREQKIMLSKVNDRWMPILPKSKP